MAVNELFPDVVQFLLTPRFWRQWYSLEVFLIPAVLLLWSKPGSRLRTSIVRRYRFIAVQPRLSICVVGLVALIHCAALATLRVPESYVPDEFSKLLAADTFASGHVTNATHPMWPHFASLHVLQQPTYQSKYPPADSLLMAFGQAVGGHPLFAAWMGLAVACGALVWMLQPWVGPSWALGGGLLAASHGRLVSDFGMTYIGGSVAMLGGALLFGALRRIVDDPRPRNAVVMAAGVALLANSRPFEGLIASLPAAVLMLVWLLRQHRFPARALARRVVLPIASLLTVTGLLMGGYNYAVVGDPFTTPYQVYRTASQETQFVSGLASLPSGTDLVTTGTSVAAQWVSVVAENMLANVVRLTVRLMVPVLMMVALLISLLPMARRRWTAFAILTFALTLLAVCMTVGAAPRYLAPVYSLFFLLVVQSLRRVWVGLRRRTRLRSVLVGCAVWSLGTQFQSDTVGYAFPVLRADWNAVRAELVEPLERDDARHLVLVRRPEGEPVTIDWVHNGADIDAAKVVWAWDIGGTPRLPLLQHFDNRRYWLLDLADEGTRPLALREIFEGDESQPWLLRQLGGAVAHLAYPDDTSGTVRAEIEQGGTESWHLTVERAHPPVRAGTAYTVRFRARADGPRQITVHVSQAHPPWQNLGLGESTGGRIDITPEWRDVELSFQARLDDDVVRVAFDVGGDTASVYLSDASVAVQAAP